MCLAPERRCDVNNPTNDKNIDKENPAVTLPGVVEKVIRPINPKEPEKAQIAIEGAEDLYKEIRIDNALEDGGGEKVKLKAGAQVDVTIEAHSEAVEKATDEGQKKRG
jgi:predicted DNA-binding antitoxin AbrB/MazE fold protein